MFKRLGQFLILIGVLTLAIFWFSLRAGDTDINYLLVGLPSFLLGVLLVLRGRSQQSSERFRTLRRLRSKDQEED
jgi:hypothetical protein